MVIVVLAAIAVAVVIAVVLVERYRTARLSDIDIDSCLRNVARLDALAATRLMDAPPNRELDALTSEAAQRLRAPMAVMSLLDEGRQFFASSYGLDGDVAVHRETPVHHSYCKYVVALDEPLKVNDSHRHRLVKDHPATRNRHRLLPWCTTTNRVRSHDRLLLCRRHRRPPVDRNRPPYARKYRRPRHGGSSELAEAVTQL